MSKLAPNRVYYPTNLKVLQKVSWDEHLPVGFQNDRYDRIIRAIVSKASRLYRFEENEDEDSKDLGDMYQSWDKILDSDLRTRGEIQRMRYECPRQDIERECPVRILDVEYVSRGCTAEPVSEVRASADCKASTVFQVVTMLHKKSRSVPMSQNISAILDEWKLFGGFLGTPLARLLPISSLVDYQTLQDQWGNILETCCLKELTVQMLKNVIETEFVEYVAGDIQAVGRKAVTAALEKERAAHMDICQDEGTRLANAFILQWPDVKAPNIGDFSSSYISPLPDLALHHNHNDDRPKERELAQPPEFAELWNIITPFETSTELLRRNYGQDLAASLKALEAAARHDILGEQRALPQILPRRDLEIAMSAYDACLQTTLRHINDCFSEASFLQRQSQVGTGYGWLQSVGLWPRLTPVSILELLRTKETLNLERNMFQALLHYGELLTGCQRIQRLSRALERNDIRRAQDELHNNGHFNWNVADYPDWLLLEIDSNMLIREEQVTVAQAMISPESAQNSVFQLNMGKGKTSMILPMVLSVLADGDQLARLIAPKALLLPTAQVLQSRLGGLVGREVRHVPFSRRLLTQQNCEETFAIFKQHHQDLTRNRGIFIAAPEHILAFKLSSEQCYVDARNMDLAVEMMQFHTHLRNNLCRDVLDESDFTLAVRTQLVYPSGTFTAVDGTPFRWELVQALLSLLEGHVANMADSNPHGINIVKRPGGGFPLVHILHPSVEDDLRSLIAEDIVQGRVLFFRPTPKAANSRLGRFQCGAHNSVSKIQSAIKAALWDDSSDEAVEEAASMFPNPEVIANGLLLMRGLLQHDILATCLKKRWNVQYGLHPKRWPIAVPYEARGVPSERSEFGHPDVTIIFTCLAFYYAGINLEQFRQGLNHVLHHVDDPATEYERWSSGDGVVTLPDDLQHWNSINVDDEGQVETLWEHLRFTRSVINHFLNTFVFPLYSRQFSVKLQASAWDLPIFTQNQSTTESSASRAKTTGFSGTNDNKSMLPLTIKQQDLPGLQQTNAEVLSYLLQQRNRNYICTGQQGKTRWTEEVLVRSLAGYRIQVFIDAGAYILEKTNISLARAWLALTEPSIKAAVFFDEKDNRAWVVFRDTTAPKAPLVSTPFAERLDECIVYYDEAHTRGVDLQLPPEARGALTLALGQTKDHTVQAAMRLRQLGTTQSVVFYAPPEVDQSIRDLCQLGNSVTKSFVNSSHVVRWLLEQTCQANEQLGSLYASHGLDFCRRTEATWKYQDTLDNPQSRKSLLDVLEQPERQTLKVMYGHAQPASTNNRGNRRQKPDRRKGKGKDESPKAAPLKQFMDQLQEYRSAGTASGVVRKGTFEEVEQEREVEVQVEQQRDTRPRKKYAALKFPGSVCKAICKFVETGVLSGDVGYQSAYAFIAGTDIGKRHNVHEIKSRLFVTAEFQRTIEGIFSGKSPRDDFLRPVEWLLWSPSTETGIVIIPEELELLIPDIHKSPFVHLVAYAAPVTRTMLDFSSLTYYSFPAMPVGYTMPAWLPVEMGILSGRLYMEFKEAMHMAQYIGQAVNVDADEETSVTEPFCANPTTFLLEWLPLRRAAKDILHTPAAYVCQGRALRPDHAFFSQSTQYQQEEKKDQTKLPKIEEVGIISPDIDFLNDGIDGLGIEVNEESSPTTEELSGNSSGTNSISDGIDELVIEVTEEEEEEIVIVRKVMVS
ncbi:hypothetical protein SEUCBS140593_003023 [Sporothrix eucalyptigena]|uniref:ubiquitinyl hydrolase 1 n=1 Tax=Sporothrix eucalyptigena TaxID=1812306 RepID=A0ABP0BBC9_9PEZI